MMRRQEYNNDFRAHIERKDGIRSRVSKKTQRGTILKQERKGEKAESGKDHAKIFNVDKAKQQSQRKGSKRKDSTKKRSETKQTLQLATHVTLRDTPYFILFLHSKTFRGRCFRLASHHSKLWPRQVDIVVERPLGLQISIHKI